MTDPIGYPPAGAAEMTEPERSPETGLGIALPVLIGVGVAVMVVVLVLFLLKSL